MTITELRWLADAVDTYAFEHLRSEPLTDVQKQQKAFLTGLSQRAHQEISANATEVSLSSAELDEVFANETDEPQDVSDIQDDPANDPAILPVAASASSIVPRRVRK